MKKLAIISASGGLDSTTLLHKALESNIDVVTVSFAYKQKHSIEKYALKRILKDVEELNPEQFKGHHIKHIELDMNLFMGNILDNIAEMRYDKKIEEATDLEYYMPFRNLVFASISAMIGESIILKNGYTELLIGLGIHKHTNDNYKKDYWDITHKFAEQLGALFALNDSVQTNVYAPYSESYKDDIVKDAIRLGVPYTKTWTCYNPIHTVLGDTIIDYVACNECEACLERQMFGVKNNVTDINKTDIKLYDEQCSNYPNIAKVLNEAVSSGIIDIGDNDDTMKKLYKLCECEWIDNNSSDDAFVLSDAIKISETLV